MEILTVIVWVMVGVMLALYLLMPKLRYKVRWRDTFRSWHNSRFQLLVFINNRYQKVLDGEQAYYRFVEETRKIYDKDSFTQSESQFDNNVTRNNLSIISEMLEDEDFIRKYFCRPPFTYDNYKAMMIEWDTRPQSEPVTEQAAAETLTPPTEAAKQSAKLSEDEINSADSISRLITRPDKAEDIRSCIASILSGITTGEEYAALILSIKKYPFIQYSTLKEIFGCINSSFSPGIKKGYNAVSSQLSRFENHTCSEDTEDRINELIEEFSKKLNEIH